MKQAKEAGTQTMEKYINDEEHDTLSLADLHVDEDTIGTEELTTTFYQDFFGVSSEEWTYEVSNKNSHVKQPICDDTNKSPEEKIEETNPVFRSNSGSFRYMRFKVGSRTGSWRSRSLSIMASRSKSRWQVFMSGFGSGKFPTKMDLIDIKTRQLRSKSTAKVSQNVDHVGTEDSGGLRVRKTVWLRLVDVLGCGGGYERNNMVVDQGIY